ncbi:hypothetical protein [Intestinibacillus massiliensis]
MKLKKYITLLCIASLLSSSTGLLASATEMVDEGYPSSDAPYMFPVTPNTVEWKQQKNRAAKVELCQIPENVQENITTSALLESVQNYPYKLDILMFDSLQKGFDKMKLEFNGLAELMDRPDLAAVVISAYAAAPVYVEDPNLDSTYINMANLAFLEILVQQPEVYAQLSDEEILGLQELIEQKHQEKLSQPDVYSLTLNIPERIIAERAQTFADMFSGPQNYSINWIQVPGSSSRVEAWTVHDKLKDTDVELLVRAVRPYETAVILGSPTFTYNCHSYAWWDASTSNKYWIIDPTLLRDSHRQISSPVANARAMSVGSWHSVIVNYVPTTPGFEPTVVSKWGPGCLCKHRLDDQPFSNSDYVYYAAS